MISETEQDKVFKKFGNISAMSEDLRLLRLLAKKIETQGLSGDEMAARKNATTRLAIELANLSEDINYGEIQKVAQNLKGLSEQIESFAGDAVARVRLVQESNAAEEALRELVTKTAKEHIDGILKQAFDGKTTAEFNARNRFGQWLDTKTSKWPKFIKTILGVEKIKESRLANETLTFGVEQLAGYSAQMGRFYSMQRAEKFVSGLRIETIKLTRNSSGMLEASIDPIEAGKLTLEQRAENQTQLQPIIDEINKYIGKAGFIEGKLMTKLIKLTTANNKPTANKRSF